MDCREPEKLTNVDIGIGVQISADGTTLGDAINTLAPAGRGVNFHLLISEIQRRSATTELDRIRGLFYLCGQSHLRFPSKPPAPVTYEMDEEPGDAWIRFVGGLAANLGLLLGRQEMGFPDVRADRLNFCLFLLENFPQPSAEHWFPSLSQVLAYPDISIQEPQIQGTPRIRASLNITAGRLYRGVKFTHIDDHAYEAEAAGAEGRVCTATLSAQTGVGIDVGIITGHAYVLLDVTPFSHPIQDQTPGFRGPLSLDVTPEWDSHLILVCRELTPGKTPTGTAADYHLRRVTSLRWIPPETCKSRWLPFQDSLRTIEPTFIVNPTQYYKRWQAPDPNVNGQDQLGSITVVLQ